MLRAFPGGWTLAFLGLLLFAPVAPAMAQPGRGAVTGQVVRCTDGRAAGFACNNVDLLAFLPLADLGATGGGHLNDLWGWTDAATGREYALVGRTNGTAFVDVTDPVNPVFVGTLVLPDGARPSTWRDVKVYADHAFVVADNAGAHGMQVFDLRRLRSVARPPTVFTETALYTGIRSAHNLALDEATGFAYVAGARQGDLTCGGGLHIVDVRTPARPAFAGCAAEAGYVHDAQCVVYRGPDAAFQGREVCVAAAGHHLAVLDVTDKARPELLASTTYPNAAYVHQGWFTEDHRYFFQNDELDETNGMVERTRTLVWDLSELTEPVLYHTYLGPSSATDHNLYVRGEQVYQANYRSGLRVLDIHRLSAPVETAFFDTYPDDDAPGFEGAWSVYPFFDSGTLVVSSIDEGLFVLKLGGLATASFDAFTAAPEGDAVRFGWRLHAAGAGVRFELEEHTGHLPGHAEWTVVGDAAAGAEGLALQPVFPGTHTYRLRAFDDAGGVLYSAPLAVAVAVPGPAALGAPYPNPFRDDLHLTLAVQAEQRVRIALYDPLGRRAAVLHDAVLPAGAGHALTFVFPPDLAAGPYALRVTGETFSETRLVTRMR